MEWLYVTLSIQINWTCLMRLILEILTFIFCDLNTFYDVSNYGYAFYYLPFSMSYFLPICQLENIQVFSVYLILRFTFFFLEYNMPNRFYFLGLSWQILLNIPKHYCPCFHTINEYPSHLQQILAMSFSAWPYIIYIQNSMIILYPSSINIY